ncbi:LysR family transcriptional regulator [Methylocella sp. CPCC 101449]|uniref:LysR family transcriptional regulator n=1 Tax=Methylocella sp. CPCC 101449 TaxID=2987531 RepID=UPI00288D8EE1|nr:LysR family transcriptional regulator [Methylocella sp. CPCC 101449]MDT2023527.1 LysR family transcriptional regulator [Methylocella sp. CPCC 101449]HEV2573936.1 LysR family transcriptional regulator [Beijerinckiaceae bacterium]
MGMIAFTLRRLQVFVAIVETGSFAAAARRLGIAQPSISAHVMALEKELGRLFERQSGRQAVLTEVGRNFLGHARELLAQAQKLEADMASQSSVEQNVALACQRSLAHTMMGAALAHFAKDNRRIRLSVRIAFQEEVIAAVRMGAADVGCLLSGGETVGFPSTLIGRMRFVIFALPDHPLAGRKRVPPAEVAQYDFVGPVATSLFGQTQRRLLQGIGVDRMHIVAEGTEFSVVRELGAAGLGLCCSLQASVQPDIDAGRFMLIDVDGPDLFLDIRMLINPQRRAARPVRQLVDYLREESANWR